MNSPLRPLRSRMSVLARVCATCASTVVVGCHPIRTGFKSYAMASVASVRPVSSPTRCLTRAVMISAPFLPFRFQRLPKFLHGSDEPRIIPHLRYARSRKRDGNLRANSPGTSGHDDHTISKKNRLLNTMRYEQHGLSGMGSESRYLLL